ncbi:MAG TPA: GtrA family protein [Hyphomonadaceae bacterium]|jgi:putative flippase GtrA|nr:GtrA family protein [Hyphomonadaceae bacterium]
MTIPAPPQNPSAEFLRFAVAGATGFAVDAGLVLLLNSVFGWQPIVARLPAFAVALVVTWLINRAWTFKGARVGRSVWAEFASYGAVQVTGGAANIGIYALMVSLIGGAPLQLLVALAMGAATGMAINYLGARRFVFDRGA